MKLNKSKVIEKLAAFTFILISVVAAVTLVWMMAMYIVPMLSLGIFKVSGLETQLNVALSLTEIPIQSLLLMIIMWLLPSLVICSFLIMITWKLLRKIGLKLSAWLKILFAKN